jgi:enoyl-CoA hydratase/carnithine racemase
MGDVLLSDRLNAVNKPLVQALNAAFDRVDARAVVLGSSTREAFCSGADLDLEDAERAEVSDLLYGLYEKMVRLTAPIVVALDGHAVGAGVQLAVAGDLRVVGPQAKLRVAGPGHGVAVAAWGLPSLVGRGHALDLCLAMRTIGAQEALAMVP